MKRFVNTTEYSSLRVLSSRILHEICLLIGELAIRAGVFNLLYHATPLTDFGMLATPHNDNLKIELRR